MKYGDVVIEKGSKLEMVETAIAALGTVIGNQELPCHQEISFDDYAKTTKVENFATLSERAQMVEYKRELKFRADIRKTYKNFEMAYKDLLGKMLNTKNIASILHYLDERQKSYQQTIKLDNSYENEAKGQLKATLYAKQFVENLEEKFKEL